MRAFLGVLGTVVQLAFDPFSKFVSKVALYSQLQLSVCNSAKLWFDVTLPFFSQKICIEVFGFQILSVIVELKTALNADEL